MKTLFIISVVFSCFAACQSCNKEFFSDSRIQKEYDIVIGILAPDSSNDFIRQAPVEVFVGKMIPTDIHNVYYVDGMQDSLLKELMINTRQFYVTYYDYDPTAEVLITGNGQTVQLAYVGFGIYRDVDRILQVKHSVDYDLTVTKKDGRTFTAHTKILPELSINGANGDTIEVTPNTLYFGDTIRISILPVDRAWYYVYSESSSNFSYLVNAYTFDVWSYDAVIFQGGDIVPQKLDFVNTSYEVRAVDSAYALFHQPHGHGGTTEFGQWDIGLYDVPIEKRSNIEGKDVVGVFGNYTADRRSVVYHANWTAGKQNNK